MGIFGRREKQPTAPAVTWEQTVQTVDYEIASWHQRNPLRTFKVYYANDQGNEKVRAHRFVLESVGEVSVFMFQVLTPNVKNYRSMRLETEALAILTVPFDRVHSINMELEGPDGTAAAVQPH